MTGLRRRKRMLFCLLVYCVLSSLWIAGCGQMDNKAGLQLIADINVSKNHLIVSNGDAFVWEDAEIIIDDKYKYAADFLPRGRTSLPLREFTDQNGNRFNPHLLKIRRVKILVPDVMEGKKGIYQW